MTEQDKEPFRLQAAELKRQHSLDHPGYKLKLKLKRRPEQPMPRNQGFTVSPRKGTQEHHKKCL